MHYGNLRKLARALMLAFLFATPVSAWGALTIDPLPSPSLNASLTVTGTCAEEATVTLDVPGAVVGPVSYPSPTAWSAAVSGLADGSHTITATSDRDEPASASVEVFVDANAPVLTVSTLPGGAVTNVALLNIAGSATDAASGPAVVNINGDAVQVQPDGAFSGAVTLVSGPNTIAVVATDQVGNSVTDSRVIRLDLSAPHLTITSPADNVVTSQGGVTVAGTVDEESVVTVALGTGSPQAAEQEGTSFTAPVNLGHGLNTITVTATDLAGNSAVAKRTVLYDSSMPNLQVTQPPQDQSTNIRTPFIAGSASDADSAVSVTIAAGGQNYSPAVAGGGFSQQLSLGGDGSYPVTVTCADQAGNQATVVRTLLLDTTAPAVTAVTTTSPAGHYGEGAQIPLTLSFSEAVTSTGVTLALSSGGSANCGAIAGGTSCIAVYTVAAGQMSAALDVVSVSGSLVDSAGNQVTGPTVSAQANLSASKVLIIDTDAPTATITGHPSDPTAQQSATFTFASDEAGSSFACSLDAGAFASCSSPVVLDLSGRPDGRHTFAVRGIDPTGNVGAAVSWSWTIDTAPPAVSAGGGRTAGSAFTQTGSVSDATATTLSWSKVSGPGVVSFGSPSSAATTVSMDKDGSYVLRLTATDAAGNSASADVTVVWDSTLPAVSAGGGRTAGNAFTQTGSVSDATATTLSWSKVSGPGAVSFGSPSAAATTVSMDKDGSYVLRLTATDAAGNSASADVTVVWDSSLPAVSAGGGRTAGSVFTQTGSVSDATATTLSWSKVSGPGTVSFGSPSAASTTVSIDKDGSYVLRLTATDAAGNSASADVTVVWDTSLPAVSAGGGRTAGSAFTQTGSVSDATATTLSWSKVSGPGAVSFGSPSSAATTVSMDKDGSYLLRLTATDAAGNSASADVAVVWDSTPPTVSAGSSRTASAPFVQTGSVSDATATTLSWSKVSGPGSVVINSPSTASTTVSMDTDGSYTLRLTATDAAGNSASADVTVVWDTSLPAVSAGGGRTAGSAFTQTGSVSDATATTLSWSKVSGPGTVSFGSPSAASTTVSMDKDGSYLLRLTATDAAGNSASADVTVVWDTSLPAVSAGGGRTAGSAFTQTGSASDATATTLSWSKVSGPGAVSFGSPSSAATTVSMDKDGSYLLRLTATDAAGNSASADVTVVWDTTSPTVSAGAGRTAGSAFTQVGSVSDATATTLSWSKVSGPGAASFGSPSAASTTVSMDKDGSYLLRLTATDAAGNSAAADVTVVWDTSLPAVSAGGGRTAGSAFTQVGSVSDATATTLSWSKVSGPGAVSFGSPSAAATTVSMDKDGSYLLRLTATDAAGNSASADVAVVWDSTPPTVSAGSSRTASAPFVQTGSVSDATATTLSWSKVSGPGAVVINSPSAASTTVSMDKDGSYLLRLTATDAAGNSASSDVTLIWDTTLPSVSAGTPRTANTAFTQSGSVADSTGTALSWSQESGPGTVSFGSPSAASTTVSMDKDGSYLLRLTATDGAGNRGYGEVIIVWDTTLPAVGAGAGRTAGSAFTQTGSVSDATATTLSWSKVSGPGTVSFGSPSAAGTTVAMDKDGSYTLRLTATDSAGNSASSDVAVVWDTTSPTVSAGPAHAANSAFSQNGSVSDATATTLSWSKVSGPGTVVFSSPASVSTTVSMDLDGTYVVRLTATDEALNSASADVTLTWDTTQPRVDAGGSRVSNSPYAPAATASDANAITYRWQQLSGPGSVAFSDPEALAPQISANADGSYTLRLTATDAAGNSASSDSTMVWDTTRPTVNAGAGRTANAPFLQSGSVVDATGTTLSWSKVSGPGAVTFDPPSAASSTVAMDRDGVYVLRLTAADAAGNSSSSDVAITWDTTAPFMVQPLPVTTAVAVDVTVSASDATPLGYLWQQLSGPGTVSLGSPGSATTSASADQDGAYRLQCTATDAAGNSSMIEVSFTWDTTAPQVAAGGSRVVNAPFIPAASAGDATPLSYRWEQLSGPGNIAFSDVTALAPQISATADGSYSLRLTATDVAGNRSSDTLALLWTTQLPVVSAGPSSAHNATFTQYGFASGTTQLTFRWSQASGPGSLTFGSPDALATTVSADQQGTYLLRLTSTDQAGNVSTSDATLIWDLASPSLSLALPPDHSYTSLQQFTVSGSVVDALSGLQSLQLNGASLTVDPEGNFSKTIQLNSGTNVITVVAIDLAGNASHSTSSVVLDQAVPTITLTAPGGSEYKTNMSQLMITGSVDHDCALGIHVSGPSGVRDYSISVLAGSLFSQLVDNLALGVTTVTLTAVTQANLSSTRVITVTYETQVPILTLTAPAGDVRPGQNSLLIAGTATDTVTTVRVTIAVNGQFYTPPVVDGQFSQTVPLTVKGLYPVTVTATNETGGATVATRRVIYATPTGDLNGDGKTDISDALLALQVSVGMRPQLDGFLVSGDLAPLVGGAPAPDWNIDIGDAVLILRVIVGSLAPPG
ncbi:PKD domain-containing protein [Geomonas anaerohicana]|uniref:Ig-like domain repeat protein n=1 Tax=Geomonas anaerohicana TaxID=2798583 RepID=A0ABS0YFM0_9BACT|nr:Ig-like domain-containing protein [Geomonas anaerohicana]MBJ6751083.1 Ig-like domain repeat protein [Geomonas anaerohicana]